MRKSLVDLDAMALVVAWSQHQIQPPPPSRLQSRLAWGVEQHADGDQLALLGNVE
jgi:hypothetical protein